MRDVGKQNVFITLHFSQASYCRFVIHMLSIWIGGRGVLLLSSQLELLTSVISISIPTKL